MSAWTHPYCYNLRPDLFRLFCQAALVAVAAFIIAAGMIVS